MSAEIFWRPAKTGTALNVGGATQAWMEVLEAAVEDAFPITLSADNIAALRGLKAGIKPNMPEGADAIDKLIAAIEEHGEIVVFAEY